MDTTTGSQDIWGTLLGSTLDAGKQAVLDSLSGGKATPSDRIAEQGYWNSLNCSGASNQPAANTSPQSWSEFFFGTPTSSTPATTPAQTSGSSRLIVLALIVLGVLAIWHFTRKL